MRCHVLFLIVLPLTAIAAAAAAPESPLPTRMVLRPGEACPPGYRESVSPLWGRWAERIPEVAPSPPLAVPPLPVIRLNPEAFRRPGVLHLRSEPAGTPLPSRHDRPDSP